MGVLMGLFDKMLGDPSSQAMYALGSGLLGVRRGNEGRAFMGAMGAYNDAQQEARRNELVQLQRKQIEMMMEQARRKQAEEDKYNAVFQDPTRFMRSKQSAFPPNEMDPEGSPASPPEFDRRLLGQALLTSRTHQGVKEGIGMMAEKEDEPFTLTEGAVRYGPNGMTIASNPKSPDLDPLGKARRAQSMFPVGSEPWKQYQALINKMITHQPAASTNVQFNTGEKGYKHSRDLASDFKSEPIYKAHTEVSNAYAQIKQGLASESPAGDLAAATKFMKLLDPGSVVRESELAMAISATGLGDRIANYVQMVVSGTKLTPAQRRDFRNMADRLYQESEKAYRAKQSNYQDIAKKYELDPSMLDLGGAPKPQTTIDSVDDLIDYYTQPGQ